MIRTQVQFSGEQMEALKRAAARQKVSIAELVRQAVDHMLSDQGFRSADERRHRALAASGRFASGRKDVSVRHDAHLAEAFKK